MKAPEVSEVSKVSKAPSDTRGVKSVPRRGDTQYDTSTLGQKVSESFDTPSQPTAYTLTLRPLPGWPTPGWQRLRALLKRALRSYGLRCTTCKPISGNEAGMNQKKETTDESQEIKTDND
jgi:hypothetical protein